MDEQKQEERRRQMDRYRRAAAARPEGASEEALPEPAGPAPVVAAVTTGSPAGGESVTQRILTNLDACCRNKARLEKLTPLELISETLASDAADYAVVVELMNRVLPGWVNLPDGTFDQQKNVADEPRGQNAPALFDWYNADNDYRRRGSTPDEALSECDFELRAWTPAFLFLRHGLSKDEALKQVENLRRLVEFAYGPR